MHVVAAVALLYTCVLLAMLMLEPAAIASWFTVADWVIVMASFTYRS